MTMKKKLYSQLAYELTYWGSPGEVIHYNLPENTPDLPESGNFFEIEQMPFHLSGEMLSENQLDYLLNHSNADCVYSSIKITLKHCKGGENKQFPEVSELPQKLILKIQEGTSEIEFLEDYPRQSLRESIIRDADADVIYDPEFIRMATREKKQSYAGFIKEHKSKYSWINNNSNLIVEYFKSDEIQLRMKLKNNSKIDNERLHELIVEGTAPEYFKIYAWKTDNSLSYLGQHEANIVPALERSSERKLKIQPSYYVGVKGESRSLKINTSSNTLNFMERNKSNAFTFYNFYAGWWAPESNFGFKGHFQLFNYRYNVKNLLGNDTITNGSMDEVNIMGSYRFSHKSKWSDYITLSLGVNRKNILVTKNISLGDIKFLSVPVEMNFLKKYKKFVFSGGAQLAKVLKAEGKFDLSSTGGDGDGFWYGFETQAAYPVFKNTFITLGTNLRKTKVSFPAGELDMNEMGFYVGLEYLNIGF